jgi:hypothetical protein
MDVGVTHDDGVSICLLCRLFSDRVNHMGRHLGPDNEQGNRPASRENQTQTQVKQSQKNSTSTISLGSGNDTPTARELSEGRGGDISDCGTDLLQAPTSESPDIPRPSTPNRHRLKRIYTNKFFGVDQEDCAESDCDDPLSQEEKVRCAGPG